MRDLTQHLTTRADDNHAPPVAVSRRKGSSLSRSLLCQALVRFFALLRIKPHNVSPPTPSNHRLRRGLPGYLILFAPHAFEPQRQLESSKPPSPLVFLRISTHFTATLGIPLTSAPLKNNSFGCRTEVEPQFFTSNLPSRLRSLYTQ